MKRLLVVGLLGSILSVVPCGLEVTPAFGEAKTVPKVKLLITGGTIATYIDPKTGRPAPEPTSETMSLAIPEMSKYANVEVERFSLIVSTYIDPPYWARFASRINEIFAKEDVAGVVVTHGSDTMEETAFFLDLTVRGDRPVVLTGAQRSSTEIGADGPGNVLSAVRVAASEQARGKGVLLVMNGQINAARDVTKSNTWAVETFRSGELGFLGYVDPDNVTFYRAPLKRQTFSISGMKPKVDIVPFYAGADGKFIRAAIDAKVDGLVIAGTGVGNANEAFDLAIKEATQKGIVVVMTTRVPNGPVFPWYAEAGGGGNLARYGVVFADNLSPQKARILLMLALGTTSDSKRLQEIFSR
jgi:L-asparaginase